MKDEDIVNVGVALFFACLVLMCTVFLIIGICHITNSNVYHVMAYAYGFHVLVSSYKYLLKIAKTIK